MLTPRSGTCSSNGALLTEKTPEVPVQSRAVLLAARVGAKAVSLHPQSLSRMRLLPTTALWKGSRGGSMTGLSGSLGGQLKSFTPPSIPSWDLSLVLTALQQGLLEPLQTVKPKFQRKRKNLYSCLHWTPSRGLGTSTHFGQ